MTAFLAVLVPEADLVVGHLRERWDPSARLGLGAHITIRYPFLPFGQRSPEDVERLADAMASVPPFEFSLGRVSRFPTTVFLDPEPVAPFAEMRAAVDLAFGDRLPIDSFPRYIPHLSVARSVRGEPGDVLEAIDAALAGGPVICHCDEVVLLERRGGPWEVRARFALGLGAG